MIKENTTKQKRKKSNLVKLSEAISQVKENLGIGKYFQIEALKNIWPLVTSFDIAKNSYPAYFDRESSIVIYVKSSSLANNLTMNKLTILAKLKEATKNTDIIFKDIRFICKG